MNAEVYRFDQWAGIGRGLISKVMLPQNVVAVQADITSGSYSVKKVGSVDPPVTGALNISEVMLASLQPWSRDPEGKTFHWNAPGTLWPDAGFQYSVKVTLVTTAILGNFGILLVWRVTTLDPDA